MDSGASPTPPIDPGWITRVLIWLAGADEETLRECPGQDWDNVRAISLLLIFAWIYQAGLIAVVAHHLLAPDGAVHPELVAGSFFIATMMLLLDAYLFIRAGFYAQGVHELARAGIDLSGGWATKLTAGAFLLFRIVLSVAFAQLTAIFVGLILYHADIVADLNQHSQQQNAKVIAAATNLVDGANRQEVDATKAAQARVDALQRQVDLTLRYLRRTSTWRNPARAQQAQAALPEIESELRTATSDLDRLRKNVAVRLANRDAAIQEQIVNSPARVDQATGFLAQLTALRRLSGNPMIFVVILLIDLISFGLELSAVIAKVTVFVPSTYAVLIARNSFMRITSIVDELEAFINRRGRVDIQTPGTFGPNRDAENPSNVTWFPTGRRQQETPTPGKRPRGRPRKNGLKGGSPSVPGKNNQNPEDDNKGH